MIQTTELLSIRICPSCKQKSAARGHYASFSCAVAHQPGDCCHYGELLVDDESYRAIMEIVEKMKVGGP